MLARDAAPSGIVRSDQAPPIGAGPRLLAALALVALLGAALAPAALAGDIIHLTNGNDIEGKIISEDDEKVVIEIEAGEQGGTITQTITQDRILSIERERFGIDFDVSGKGAGLRSLLGTLPENWQQRWQDVSRESSTPGLLFLYAVTAAWFIFLPALLLHAGSSIVGVADPSYSRAVMCIVLIWVFTVLFAWGANQVGLLVTLKLVDFNILHLLLIGPLYLLGQTFVYKWSYVTDWQKAIPLVGIGLLVTLITAAAFLVLLSILA